MQAVNGCTVIPPTEDSEPVGLGPTETEGAYQVLVGRFPPGEPPPAHVHPTTDEVFYVADGDATFLLGDREISMTAGSLVLVPRGVRHAVWNSGSAPLRGLIVISPGDREHVVLPAGNGEVVRPTP